MKEVVIRMRRIENAETMLQPMLDGCGIVTLSEAGCYLVSHTLIIHSHTRFILGPDVIIKGAPMSRCALMENEHFCDSGCDQDITVEGGIWDGNCDEMGLDAMEETSVESRTGSKYDPRVFKGKLIRFAHIDRITLEKMTVRDPVSYGIQIADSKWFTVRNIHFDYNCNFGTTDGVHINGPAQFGLIENLTGITNDDMVSLTSSDESHAEVTRGPIDSVEIRNIMADNGYSGIRLLSRGDPVTNIRVSGVYGTYRHNAVLISQHELNADPVWFDNIIIEHVYASKSVKQLEPPQFVRWEKNAQKLALVWLEKGIVAGTITLRDIARIEARQTVAPMIQIDRGAIVEKLNVGYISQTLPDETTAPILINGNVEL